MLAFNNDTKYILYNGHHNHIRIAYTAATTLTWSQEALESYPKLEDYKSCRSPDARYCGSAESVFDFIQPLPPCRPILRQKRFTAYPQYFIWHTSVVANSLLRQADGQCNQYAADFGSVHVCDFKCDIMPLTALSDSRDVA